MLRIGDYGLEPDAACWRFGKVGTRTNGNGEKVEYIAAPSYPHTLHRVCQLFLEASVRDANPQSVDELIAAIQEANRILQTVADALADLARVGRTEGEQVRLRSTADGGWRGAACGSG